MVAFFRLFLPKVHVNQAVPGGVAYQFHGAMDIQFSENIGPVVLNCLLTDEQLLPDGFLGKYLTGNRRQGTPGGDHARGKGRIFGTGNSDPVHGHYLPGIAPPEKTRSGYRSQCLYGGLGYAGSHGYPHRKSAPLVMDDGLSFV